MKETRKSLIDSGINRIRLQNVDYELNTDKESVSYGGSCLVYRAVKKDPHTHLRDQKVILKEFYPAHEGAGQWRKEHGWLELPGEVEAGRTKFEKSYERFIALCNQNMDVNTTKAHNTLAAPVGNSVFLEMEYSSGITLETYMETCSLFDFFTVMQNLAGVIGTLHGNGYIHMDIKPANILCLASNPKQPEFRNITRLLDTDSFIWKGAFSEEEPHIVLSVTPKYAAPEAKELLIKQKDFADSIPLLEIFEDVGDRVDQYSMGAIIYAYIFGSCPAVPYDEDHSYEERLEECLQQRSKYIPYKAISLIRDLLKKTLARDPYDRYETMSEIETEIGKILRLVDDKKVQLRDNCRRNPDKILGREQKILKLRQNMTDPALQDGPGRVVIVTGIGGIGKSSLAREYAAIYAEDYDIKAEVSAASVRDAVDRIQIENDPTDGIWDPDVRIEKKKKIIINLCKEYRTLLIVNDYDTSKHDDAWNNLGCDVILTSRHDWKYGTHPTISLTCNDLTPEMAREIFESYYLQDAGAVERHNLKQALDSDEENLWALLRYLNYHSLGIKLMARQMTFLPGEAILPAAMLKSLKEEGFGENSLEEFPNIKDIIELNENAYGHLAALFRTAFATGRLRPEDKKALRYMTLVDSNMGISKKRFAQWTGLKATYLQRLKLMGWLEYLPTGEDLLDDTKGRGIYVSVWPEDPEEIRQYETTKGTYVMPSVIQEVLRREPDLACSVANCCEFVRSAIDSEGDKGFTAVRIALYEQRKRLLQLLPEENSVEYAQLLMTTAEPLVSDFLGCEVDDYLRILSIYKKSLEMLKAWPDTYKSQLLCFTKIIYCYGFLGNFEVAYLLSEELLDERRKLGLETDRSYFRQMHTIYGMEFRSGKMKEAIRHMGQLLQLHMEKKESDLFASASTFAELGQMLRKVGCWQQAEKMLLAADQRFIQLFYSEDGPLAIEMHNRMLMERGMLCLEAMKYSLSASRLLITALSLSQEFMQPTDLRVGDMHFYLAECWAKGNPHIRSYAFEKAAEHRKQALEIYQKQLHPGDFKIVLTKLLLALDYGEIPGMEEARDALLAECDADIPRNTPEFVKGDPCGNFCKHIHTLARNSEADKQIPWMFEFLEERRKLHLRFYGKDERYLRNCEDLAELCEKYDLTEKAAHYRMIMDWD